MGSQLFPWIRMLNPLCSIKGLGVSHVLYIHWDLVNIAEKSKPLHFKARPAQICSTNWQRMNKDAPHVRATRHVLSLFFIIIFISSFFFLLEDTKQDTKFHFWLICHHPVWKHSYRFRDDSCCESEPAERLQPLSFFSSINSPLKWWDSI